MTRAPLRSTGAARNAAFALVALSCVVAAPVLAVMPDEVLRDPALEARARELSKELRCIVCQNQNIDDSNAPLARDLRVILRERLVAGDTDRQAVDYIVSRYGNFVLLKPPLQWNTLPLWIGPALVFLIGAFGFWRYVRGRTRGEAEPAPAPPTQEEEARLQEILNPKGLK